MALIQTFKRYPLLTYFVLVSVLTWACWIPLAISKTWASFPFVVFAALGNSMPSLLGILLTALFRGKSGLLEVFRRLGQVRVPLIWYAIVLLYPPVLWLVALGVPTLLGLATVALPRLQASLPALSASLLLGVLWGLWHLPLLIAQGLPLAFAGLVGFISYVLAYPLPLAVLFTWVYNNTKGSLLLMVLFHTVIDIVGWTILAPSTTWIVPVLYLILDWVVVTLVVVKAGAAVLWPRLRTTRGQMTVHLTWLAVGRS